MHAEDKATLQVWRVATPKQQHIKRMPQNAGSIERLRLVLGCLEEEATQMALGTQGKQFTLGLGMWLWATAFGPNSNLKMSMVDVAVVLRHPSVLLQHVACFMC